MFTALREPIRLCTVRSIIPERAELGGCRTTFHRYAMVPKGTGDGQDEGAEAMQKTLSLTIAGVAVLSLIAANGCVTKKAWRTNVAAAR